MLSQRDAEFLQIKFDDRHRLMMRDRDSERCREAFTEGPARLSELGQAECLDNAWELACLRMLSANGVMSYVHSGSVVPLPMPD